MAVLRRVRPWVRGYSRAEVDSYCSRAVAALRHNETATADSLQPGFSAAEIRRVGFAFAWGGWDCGSVDRMLDALEQRAVSLTLLGRDLAGVVHELSRESSAARALVATGVDGARFPRADAGRSGYAPEDVDALVHRLLAQWDSGIDADDVRFAVFATCTGGYDEHAVDDAFDAVIDLALRQAAASAMVLERQAGFGDEVGERRDIQDPSVRAGGADS